MITTEIRRIAKDERLAALGFAPASELDGEPRGYRPSDFLPGARGLVGFALPVPRAVYRTPAYAEDMVCRAQSLVYRRLDSISLRIAGLLEGHGEQAIPVFGCSPMAINSRGDIAGYVDQIRIAEAAGMGAVGRNGLLVHPRYGARLMLGAVVTTAAFPRPRRSGSAKTGCPPDCRICVDACPVRAIDPDGKKIHIMRCLAYTSRTPLMSRLEFAVRRALRPESAARLINQTALDEHILHICSRCVALCPYGAQG